MADEHKDQEGAPLPPKLDLRKSGILRNAVPKPPEPGPPAVEPSTPAAPAAPRAATPGGEAAPAKKKETSRIPLGAARMPTAAGPAPGGEPKTIRIKPTTTPSALRGGGEAAGEAADKVAATKRTTSRISLEAVLGGEAEGAKPAEGAPKTIRLKRPGDTGGLKAVAAGMEAGAAAEAAPTVRKTIRVRRAGEPEGARPVIARAAEPAARVPVAAVLGEEGPPNVAFPLCALATILVGCILIYMLMAQALGPDLSLTQLSMGARDVDLPWPGKIPAMMR